MRKSVSRASSIITGLLVMSIGLNSTEYLSIYKLILFNKKTCMKLKTHFVFSIGLLTLASSFFGFSLIISAIISVLGNTLIDRLGHKEISTRYGKIPVRTPLTHTLPRSVFWGLISSMPVIIVLGLAYGMLNTKILTALIDGILVGPSHMLLDVFTENGIYVKRNGKWKRVALAHFSYDSSLINGLAIVLGIIMIFAAMELHH